MDGSEPVGFVRSALPARTLLTARELFNWLIYGSLTNQDRVADLAAEMVGFWGYGPGLTGTSNEMLFALREMAGQLDQLDQTLLQACETIPDWLVKAREQAASPTQIWAGVPPKTVVALLERQLSTYRQAVAAVASWSDQLLEHAVSGELSVIASLAAPLRPGFQISAAGRAHKIPETDFATVGARIEPSGIIIVPGEPGYVHAQFYTEQVRARWKVPASVDTEVEVPVPMPSDEVAVASKWMQLHVTEYIANQRDDRVRECMAAVGVKRVAAKAGWKALPQTIRGKDRLPK